MGVDPTNKVFFIAHLTILEHSDWHFGVNQRKRVQTVPFKTYVICIFFLGGGVSEWAGSKNRLYIYIYTFPLKSHDGLKAYLLRLPIFLRVSMFVFRPSNLTHQVGWMFSPFFLARWATCSTSNLMDFGPFGFRALEGKKDKNNMFNKTTWMNIMGLF